MTTSLSILAASALGVAALSAQVSTTPVGYETLDIQASAFNYLGIRLHQPVLVSGDMAATNATTVQDAGADFSALTGANTWYILEATDGSGTIAEFRGSDVSSDTITLVDDLQSLGTFTYKIRAAATLDSVFGATNSAGLATGFLGPAGADVVYVPDGSGGFDTYYYDSFQSSWADASTNGAVTGSEVPLVYADGVVLSATASAPASITITGEVKTGKTSVILLAGFNYISSIAPAGATLKSSFDASELTQGFLGPAGADLIYVPDGSGGFDRYYYDSFQSGWADADTNTLLSPSDGSGVSLTQSGVIVAASGQKAITVGVPDSYQNL